MSKNLLLLVSISESKWIRFYFLVRLTLGEWTFGWYSRLMMVPVRHYDNARTPSPPPPPKKKWHSSSGIILLGLCQPKGKYLDASNTSASLTLSGEAWYELIPHYFLTWREGGVKGSFIDTVWDSLPLLINSRNRKEQGAWGGPAWSTGWKRMIVIALGSLSLPPSCCTLSMWQRWQPGSIFCCCIASLRTN